MAYPQPAGQQSADSRRPGRPPRRRRTANATAPAAGSESGPAAGNEAAAGPTTTAPSAAAAQAGNKEKRRWSAQGRHRRRLSRRTDPSAAPRSPACATRSTRDARRLSRGMGYGMIGWVIPLENYPDTYNGQPLAYAALAAQKNAYSLYLNCVYASPDRTERLRRPVPPRARSSTWARAAFASNADDLGSTRSRTRSPRPPRPS